MAKKKEEEMIRVHNKGKRTIDYYPDPDAKKKKPKYILPNRAVEMKESVAKKYLKSYPHDLIEFDSLLSGEKKNISKENVRLESENSSYLEKIEKLESENKSLKENADPDVQLLKDRIKELEDEATDPNIKIPGGFQKKETEDIPSEDQETEPEKGPEETTGTDHDETTDGQENSGQENKE